MLKLKLTLISLFLLVLSGCSSGININSTYGDLNTATHKENALFEGRSFIYSSHFNTSVGIPVYFLGCTQNKTIHFESFNLELEGTPFNIHFYENPHVLSNGIIQTAQNLNRFYNNSHDLILYANPTINTTGTQIFHSITYGKSNLAGSNIISTELILNINTCYLFEIINDDGANAEVTTNFIWHEFE